MGPTAKPVDLSEVRTAISELTAVAGASRPHIRTASEDGFSDTSDGSSADALLAEADSPVLDDLAAVVANLLNDPKVGPMVEDALYRDPKFMEMRERYLGQNALPAPARVLALPAPYSPSQPHRSMAPGDNPIDAFFAALVGMLGKVGQAVCALGNAIRRLPEDLRTVM